MKTRTLLLLAVGCGLAILLAGGVMLFLLAGDDSGTEAMGIGGTGRAGDVEVTLDAVRVDGDVLSVDVRVGGADDPDGIDGFRLISPPATATASPSSTCAGITNEATECTLDFDTSTFEGSARVLLFRRADTQLSWSLTAP